jgi:hypothetical protein
MYTSFLMARYCSDLIIFGTCEEKMFFIRALQIFLNALIKKNRPISDITWLNQLDRAKGHSKTYDNMTAAIFLWNLFPSEREKLIDIFYFCRYYTRSQTGKSTGYRPTLKPLYSFLFSNTVIHGEGEKVNFRENVNEFFPLRGK